MISQKRCKRLKHGCEKKRRLSFPVFVSIADDGSLQGFASYGVFRAFPGYKFTLEHSLYVAKEFRGQGIGKQLLQKLIQSATDENYRTLIACIDSQNKASIVLHEKFGFQHSGSLKEVGYKFDAWLDLEFYQLVLETAKEPTGIIGQ